MREYIIVIVGAALLSVFADIISPETWKKYIKIVTGIIIICVIITPIASMRGINMLDDFDLEDNIIIETNNNQKDLVIEEFKRLIENDVKEKIKSNYNQDCTVQVSLSVNDQMEIESINELVVYVDNPSENLKNTLCQMYGLTGNTVSVLAHK